MKMNLKEFNEWLEKQRKNNEVSTSDFPEFNLELQKDEELVLVYTNNKHTHTYSKTFEELNEVKY